MPILKNIYILKGSFHFAKVKLIPPLVLLLCVGREGETRGVGPE